MPVSPFTIAIDGPSGSGKSSVSRAVAQRLGLAYLDTGAMYRALAWWCLEQGLDLSDQEVIAQASRDLPLVIGTDPVNPSVNVDGVVIDEQIRTTRISEQVSAVATNLGVRADMQARQRAIIAHERQHIGGVVVEGRDITTVVAPDAEYRLLLTASEEARLARRALELHGTLGEEEVAATRDQVLRRDADDATVSAFFEPADGVTGLDTSALNFEQVVAAVLDLVSRPSAVAPADRHTPEHEEIS